MSDPQHDQAAEQPTGLPRRVLQRGHSGEGSDSALELMRQRRALESLGSLRSDAEQQPDHDA